MIFLWASASAVVRPNSAIGSLIFYDFCNILHVIQVPVRDAVLDASEPVIKIRILFLINLYFCKDTSHVSGYDLGVFFFCTCVTILVFSG